MARNLLAVIGNATARGVLLYVKDRTSLKLIQLPLKIRATLLHFFKKKTFVSFALFFKQK